MGESSTGWDHVGERNDELIYVVDDEELPRELLVRAVQRAGYQSEGFDSAGSALTALKEHGAQVSVLLTDLDMPGMNGHALLSELRTSWPSIVPIVVTGASDVSSAVSAIRAGAYDYLVKPVDPETTLLPSISRALEHKRLVDQNVNLNLRLSEFERDSGIVGDSAVLRAVHAVINAVAPTDATVLVTGETGTGKELVARAIHRRSRRNGKPFIAINCGALTETLLESELFGHGRGAFTNAVAARRGLFEEASGGTLFLDEVGELTPATQVRLLRVLQEGQVRPVGTNKPVRVDVRIIAATNRDLMHEVNEGTFREDLYYRLDVMRIALPPLRERREDIPALVQHFLTKRSARLGKIVKYCEQGALDQFCDWPWPGNIRELENTIDRAIVLARGDSITLDLVPFVLRGGPRSAELPEANHLDLPLAEAKTEFETAYVRHVLERARGKATAAAKLAGMDPSNFRRLLKRLDIDAQD